MRSNVLNLVFSLLLSSIVILPYAIQTIHAFQGHEHKTCSAMKVKHFHQKENDCGVYHLILNQYSIDFSDENILEVYNLFKVNPYKYYNNTYIFHIQSKSSRAPPSFIV